MSAHRANTSLRKIRHSKPISLPRRYCKAIYIEINATFVIAALPAVEHNFAVGTQGSSICHAAE
jgi:hypothetical protein